ncbi:MAG TPA: Hsp70 family protein, partial [Pirellulales bacterium]|nr:Hsp70 family protein [Pirellulales bacterium]
LVYDLGGGTFDVTVVRYTPSHFQVLATDGDVQLGGIDWNDRLVSYIAEEFKSRHGSDPRESPASLQMIRHDADQAKIALSQGPETTIPCRHDGKAMSIKITREQFEDMTADLLQRTCDTTQLVIEQAGVTAEQLDAVVLVGGSTLMPKVPLMLHQQLGKAPFQGLSPHTSVAQGAAIHAAILEAKFRGESSELAERIRKLLRTVKQEDVNSHGLGVAARNPKTGKTINHVMIPRNSKLPAEVHRTFVTSEPNQQRVNIKVIEGDAPDPDACSLLGNCRISGLPKNLPKGSPIEVIYAFDASGRVRVRAHDKTGGKEAEIEIERRNGLNDSQLTTYTSLADSYRVE